MVAVDWTDPALTGQRPDATIERDRWGRYRIPHPDTGKVQSWTRATTLAGTLADRFGLEQWSKRNVVLGLGARADLYPQAAACTPDNKDTLNGIVAQAEEASKAKAGANLGTALHRFTERLDAGETVRVPDPWARDVDAYRQVMSAAGVAIVDGWLERVLVVPQIDAAGTCDRLVNAMDWTLPRIGDLKTGQDVVRYSMVEIALQLAIYSRATHWFDPATRRLHEMPPVDQDRALVMHVPVGQGVCTLYEVDIAAGWGAVGLAVAVREWRKRKDLAEQMVVIGTTGNPAERQTLSEPPVQALSRGNGDQPAAGSTAGDTGLESEPAAGPTLAPTDRVDWLRVRIEAIQAAGYINELALTWPTGTPTLKQGGLTDAHVDAIARVCDIVETAHRLPFGDTDPLFAGFDKNPGVALERAVTEARVPQPTAHEWAERARALLAPLEDEAVQHAVAVCAGAVGQKMTRQLHNNVAALVTELNDPEGAVALEIDADGRYFIVSLPHATNRLQAVSGALKSAKAHAKTLGLPVPRSLSKAAESPLLAALVAAGQHQ